MQNTWRKIWRNMVIHLHFSCIMIYLNENGSFAKLGFCNISREHRIVPTKKPYDGDKWVLSNALFIMFTKGVCKQKLSEYFHI